MKLEHIKELMVALDKSNLQELSFRDGEIKLVLKKKTTEKMTTSNPIPTQIVSPQEIVSEISEEKKLVANAEKKENIDLYYLESPLVGTFYRASGPDAAPYVEIGSVVKKGDPVCIIEAMKIMNVIDAEVSGIVEAIYVENAHFVEYKSKILAIKKT